MNKDQTINLIQTLSTVIGGAMVSKGIGDAHLWVAITGAVVAVATWVLTHNWNSTPTTMAPVVVPNVNQAGFVRVPMLLLMLSVSLALFAVIGCAHIQPGNDPIVVNAERAQSIAAPSLDLVLETDNADRAFWEKNAPAFHNFCEWLRQRQIAYLADGTPTNVQRSIAMQLNLDKVKMDYKASKVSSNAVIEAISTLQSVQQQADAWLITITNSPVSLPVELNPQP